MLENKITAKNLGILYSQVYKSHPLLGGNITDFKKCMRLLRIYLRENEFNLEKILTDITQTKDKNKANELLHELDTEIAMSFLSRNMEDLAAIYDWVKMLIQIRLMSKVGLLNKDEHLSILENFFQMNSPRLQNVEDKAVVRSINLYKEIMNDLKENQLYLDKQKAITTEIDSLVKKIGVKQYSVLETLKSSENLLDVIDLICQRFPKFDRKLQNRYNNRQSFEIKDEYDVQDLLEALLSIFFDDIRKEEWTPSKAGAASRTDFLLKLEKIVIEVKMTRNSLRDRKLGDEISIDINRYKSHPDCERMYFFIYDPKRYLNNPTGLENDFSDNKGKKILVRVYPKD